MKLKTLSLLAAFVAAPALAADPHAGHKMEGHPQESKAAPATAAKSLGDAEAEGTINGIDPDGMLMNVTHGPIPAFKWPAMTMDIPVADAALFDKVQPGDKVKLKIRRLTNVDYAIIQVEKIQ